MNVGMITARIWREENNWGRNEKERECEGNKGEFGKEKERKRKRIKEIGRKGTRE